MPQINATLTTSSGAMPAIASPSADGTASTSDPFVAILQQQIAATATADPLLTALAGDTDTAASDAAADPLNQALLALAAAMQAGTGVAAPSAKGTDGRDQNVDEAVPLIDPLATTAQPIAAPLLLAGNIEPVAEPLPTAPSAQTTSLDVNGSVSAKGAAILAAEPEAAIGNEAFANKLDATLAIALPQHAAQTAVNTHPAAHTTMPTAIPVAAPVASKAWNADVANSVAWMVGQNQSRAELVLTPPELGRVEVSISVNGDQASASFVSASPAVREALENALPRLREVLADAGVTLAQTHVGSESSGQSAKQQENGDNSAWNQASPALVGNTASGVQVAQTVGSWYSSGRSMVDVFA